MMWYALAGALFGLIGGMGMGGGIILIPALTLLLGEHQHAAQGMNLLAFLPMSAAALVTHYKNRRLDFRGALPLGLGGLGGALLGAWLAGLLQETLLKKLFGGFLILLGVYRGIRALRGWLRKRKQG